jgi:hypothetical protein
MISYYIPQGVKKKRLSKNKKNLTYQNGYIYVWGNKVKARQLYIHIYEECVHRYVCMNVEE